MDNFENVVRSWYKRGRTYGPPSDGNVECITKPCPEILVLRRDAPWAPESGVTQIHMHEICSKVKSLKVSVAIVSLFEFIY